MLATSSQVNNYQIKEQLYGQLVIGPPGSGKTTYCEKISDFYKKIERKVKVVNLDPGNEFILNYKPEIDVMDLIRTEDVMNYLNLGPNGSLLYCMEYLEKNFEWLLDKLQKSCCKYFIFDCPGQVELYTHHDSMPRIFEKLSKLGYNLCTINLIDSHYCSSASKFISTLILSLTTMLKMAQPHVNILSKADQFKLYEKKLPFNLDYYTDVLDLKYLLDELDENENTNNGSDENMVYLEEENENIDEAPKVNSNPMKEKFKKLNAALISMIEDYGLVSFQPLDVTQIDSFLRLNQLIDKANGYVFNAGEEKSINTLLACAIGAETESERMSKDIDPYV